MSALVRVRHRAHGNSSLGPQALLLFLVLGLIIILSSVVPSHAGQPEKKASKEAAVAAGKPEARIGPSTADHARHKALRQAFARPQDVTNACISCHNNAALQMHKTIHWTWIEPADPERKLGKAGLTFNNFCVAISSNEPRCTSCHAGFGWKSAATFDFSSQENVDCMVCHDRTGTYKKFPTMAGYPVSEPTVFEGETFYPPDFNAIAASVSNPTRNNCGTCHFYGGGGDAVKRGDLDSTMIAPSRELDVHMSPQGANFVCQRCHTTEAHVISGRGYNKPAFTTRKTVLEDDRASRMACESCHTAKPHPAGHKANDHTKKIACQTCHIPKFARGQATKVWWDWSTAGKKKDGKPFVEKGAFGKTVYDTKKGDFRWDKDVTPEYYWYNGTMKFLLLTDVITDTSKPVVINKIQGSKGDPNSRIMPFKAHRGRQPFDAGNKTFVVPHLFGKDEAAFWQSYDWVKAVASGQKSMNLPFSGKLEFVETVYYYPITHQVAPAENALACNECHKPFGGRLAGVAGIWMPGRDRNTRVDDLGWFGVFCALLGVGGHGLMRVAARVRKIRREGLGCTPLSDATSTPGSNASGTGPRHC